MHIYCACSATPSKTSVTIAGVSFTTPCDPTSNAAGMVVSGARAGSASGVSSVDDDDDDNEEEEDLDDSALVFPLLSGVSPTFLELLSGV